MWILFRRMILSMEEREIRVGMSEIFQEGKLEYGKVVLFL